MGIWGWLCGSPSEIDEDFDNSRVYVRYEEDSDLCASVRAADRNIDEDYMIEQGFEPVEDTRGIFRRLMGF